MSPVPFKKKNDGEPTTADEHNEKWLNGAEHDKHIMLQELKIKNKMIKMQIKTQNQQYMIQMRI